MYVHVLEFYRSLVRTIMIINDDSSNYMMMSFIKHLFDYKVS